MATEVSSYARGTQPYSCIGFISATFPNGKIFRGTCTLVGRNDILTATHVIYSPDDGGWAVGYDFYFGADYNAITDRFEDKGYKYSPTQWSVAGWPDQTFMDYNNKTMLPSETKFDIAMIGVAEPIGDVLGWLGLDPGYNSSHSANAVGYSIGTTGMMQETVTVQKDFYNEIYKSNYTTMRQGSSGGPLLIDNYVIGVMSAGVANTAMWADVGTVYSYLTNFMDSNDSLLAVITDTTAPTVSSFSPMGGTTAVSTTTNIVVTFNEAIQRGTGTIGLWNSSSASYVETFDVATSSRLIFSGSTLTIDPLNTLANNTGYFVTFDTGNIKDLAGNVYGGTYDYNFTTAIAPIAWIEGTPLNDRLIATSQNEIINGADGIDTVVYSGLRDGYTITQANQNITITDIANSKSIDTLISIERLAFSDENIAFDLNGHAGTTAKILGAVFGADAISNKSYAGIGLKFLDEGMSYESLMALAIDATGVITHQAVIDLLWNNVVGGGLPSNEQAQPFVDMLNNGLSFGQLGILAADTDLNKVSIDLVGLAQTGLAYAEVS